MPPVLDAESASCRVAVIQMTSTIDREANLQQAEDLISQAASAGAQLVATPEHTPFLGPEREKAEQAESLEGPSLQRLADLACRKSIFLLVGSFAERVQPDHLPEHLSAVEGPLCHNTSVLIGPDGKRLATYRKRHLFDIDLGPGVRFRESGTVVPGGVPAVAPTPWGRLGMAICYDLRFPEVFEELRSFGAEMITIPAAFTVPTGRDHWKVLLRARAIETQCWILAPAQTGRHDHQGRRESFGHSMIIDPWGKVLAEVPSGNRIAVAEIDRDHLERIRAAMPVAAHRAHQLETRARDRTNGKD